MITPEKREQILAALQVKDPPSFRQIAKEIGGVGRDAVRAIAIKEGIKTPLQGLTPSERMKRLHTKPDFLARKIEASKETLRRLNADPEIVKKRIAATSQNMRRLNADPHFVAASSDRLKRLNDDPAFVRKRLAGVRRRMSDRRLKKSEPSPGGNG